MIVSFNKIKKGKTEITPVELTMKEFVDMLANQNIQDGINIKYFPDDYGGKVMVVSWK